MSHIFPLCILFNTQLFSLDQKQFKHSNHVYMSVPEGFNDAYRAVSSVLDVLREG